MDPYDNSSGSPCFRSPKGLLQTVGGFIIVGALACFWLMWYFGCLYKAEVYSGNSGLTFNIIIACCFAISAVVLTFLATGAIKFKRWARKALLSLGLILAGFVCLALLTFVLISSDYICFFANPSVVYLGLDWMFGSFIFVVFIVTLVIVPGAASAFLIVIYRSENVTLTTKEIDSNARGELAVYQLLLIWYYGFHLVWVGALLCGVVEQLHEKNVFLERQPGYTFIFIHFLLISVMLIATISAPQKAWYGAWLFVILWAIIAYLLKFHYNFDATALKLISASNIPERDDPVFDKAATEMLRAFFQIAFKTTLVLIIVNIVALAGYLTHSRNSFLFDAP